MPLYEYSCPCGKKFEEIHSFEDEVHCPVCNGIAQRQMSLFSFKIYNPFTKDGEGFSSKRYSKQEYKERVKANAGKYESL